MITNSSSIRRLRQGFSLSGRQKSILAGALLGDANLNRDGWSRHYRLQLSQGDKQKDYLFWKFGEFGNCCVSEPAYQGRNDSWRIRTVSHPEFDRYAERFYSEGRKVVPPAVADLLDPLSLAIWFMDDGALGPRGDGYILNTQNFTLEENHRLRMCLNEKFGLKEISVHKDRQWWRLYIRKASAPLFRKLVDPRIISSMRYKLQFLTP
jgi:recombination protein RecA